MPMTNEQLTVMNRDDAIKNLKLIINYAKTEIERIEQVPVLNDSAHADLVRGYSDRCYDIRCDMEDLHLFGRIKG